MTARATSSRHPHPFLRDSQRVLLFPYARQDAAVTARALASAGMASRLCGSIDELCEEIEGGAGAVVLAEERLTTRVIDRMRLLLGSQPAWSDLPIVVIGARRRGHAAAAPGESRLAALGNVTLLVGPIRIRSLVCAAQAAIRSRQRQYAARRAIEQRDRFLATLGHELRNPLAAISLATQMGNRDPARAAGVMPLLLRQVKLLGSLLDDLLDVARVSTGKIVLKREPVPLGSLVEKAVTGLRPRVEEAGLHLHLQVDPEAAGAIVRGDSVRLEQVVVNLLSNAIKYTPTDGRVRVLLDRTGEQLALQVQDTGVGISAEMLPLVFEAFFQAETSLSRAEGGMGVGLALVQTLVELHGGRVAASSPGIGRGSTFTVWLPLHRPAVIAADDARSGEHAPPTDSPQDIVVVEDNADARELLVDLLQHEGHRVTQAPDGERGLELLLARRPHAAIVDIGLPGIDGYEVARRARARLGRDLLLIALTGYGQRADYRHALESGFDVHLIKPVTVDDIREVLARPR